MGRGRKVQEASTSQKKRNERAQQIMEQLNSRDEVKEEEATTLQGIIKEEADEIRDNMNEDVQRIRDDLRGDNLTGLKERINQIKTEIKNVKFPDTSTFIWVPILVGILTYLICCFSLCEENDCCGPILLTFPLLMSKKALCRCLLQTISLLKKIPCEDDTKLLSTPPVIEEKLTELATLFQEEDTQDDLLMFWIPLVLGVLFGILLIGSLIAGLLKWIENRARNNQSLLGINNEGNWVYGSRVQDKAALTAEKGQNLAPVEETK